MRAMKIGEYLRLIHWKSLELSSILGEILKSRVNASAAHNAQRSLAFHTRKFHYRPVP